LAVTPFDMACAAAMPFAEPARSATFGAFAAPATASIVARMSVMGWSETPFTGAGRAPFGRLLPPTTAALIAPLPPIAFASMSGALWLPLMKRLRCALPWSLMPWRMPTEATRLRIACGMAFASALSMTTPPPSAVELFAVTPNAVFVNASAPVKMALMPPSR
jgi:hypothetical protein